MRRKFGALTCLAAENSRLNTSTVFLQGSTPLGRLNGFVVSCPADGAVDILMLSATGACRVGFLPRLNSFPD